MVVISFLDLIIDWVAIFNKDKLGILFITVEVRTEFFLRQVKNLSKYVIEWCLVT